MKNSHSKTDGVKLTRREFLDLAKGVAGLSVFSSPLLRSFAAMTLTSTLSRSVLAAAGSSTSEPHMLLHLRANGGWDVLMAMDAKNLSKFPNGNGSSRLLRNPGRAPARSFSTGALGPAMAPLFPHLQDVAIINGIMSVEDSVDHLVNRAYMSTGSTDVYATYLPFLIAKARGGADRVGHQTNDSLLDGSYEKKVPLNDLESISATPSRFAQAFAEANLKSGAPSSQANLIREQTRDTLSLSKLATARETLRLAYKDSFGGMDAGTSAARMALAGFASGYIQSAICEFTNDFDTHNDHERRQTATYQQVFTGLAKLIETMKNTVYQGPGADGKKTLFDLTTVIVTSDFSRSSDRQGDDGTDHNQFNNSCLLFGKGIAGGKVIGQSDVYLLNSAQETRLHANCFDFQSQRPLSKSETLKVTANAKSNGAMSMRTQNSSLSYIYPESIWWTVAQSMGIKTLGGLEASPVLKTLLK